MAIHPPDSLAKALRLRKCVLFAGAGLSAGAGLPTWAKLIREMVETLGREGQMDGDGPEIERLISAGKLLEVADHCKERLGAQAYMTFLQQRLRGATEPIPEILRVIARLPFYAVVTTNYDKLLERALGTASRVCTHMDSAALAMSQFADEFFVVKAHGDIDRPETIVLTAADYRTLIHNNEAFRTAFTTMTMSKVLLFVGYSLTDPDFRLLLDRQLAIFGDYVPDRYALLQNIGRVEREVLWRTARVRALNYEEHAQLPAFFAELERTQACPTPTPPPPLVVTAEPTVRKATAVRRGEKGWVLFVPGFCASELEAGGKVVWMNMARLATGGLGALELDAEGIKSASQVRASGLLQKWSAGLQMALAERYRTEVFPYDWRLDIAHTADALAVRVRELLAGGCGGHLVAHSLGGLVARMFVQRHPDLWAQLAPGGDAPPDESGGRLLLLGTPNRGCLIGARTLSGLEQTIRSLAILDLTRDVRGVLKIFQTFPALYQMLPTPGTSPESDELYAMEKYGGYPVSQRHLERARQTHAALAGTLDARRMICIVGRGQQTPVGVRDASQLGSEDGYIFEADGDGVVPLASGMATDASGTPLPAFGVSAQHGMLTSHDLVLEALGGLLAEGNPGALTPV